MAHLRHGNNASTGSTGLITSLYKRNQKYFCVLGCDGLAHDSDLTDMKRHYVERHGQLELCLWGIDKHTLMRELGLPVKHTKIDQRMTQVRDILTLIGKDCDVVQTSDGNSMIVPRRGKNGAQTPQNGRDDQLQRKDTQAPMMPR